MSNCETYRELLVESVYDEIGARDQLRLNEHLAGCEACAARRTAFGAVRRDLRQWEVEAPPPSRVTFVAMPVTPRHNPWTRRLAAPASFFVGFLLIAAVANLEVQNDGDGWSIRTSLIPRAAETTRLTGNGDADSDDASRPRSGPVERLEAEQPRFGVPVSQGGGQDFRFMSQDDLDSWLEQRLQARGLPRTDSVAELHPDQVRPLLDDLMGERDQQIRTLIQEALGRAQDRTRDEFDAALTGLYQAFEAQRTNDLLFFAGELGLLQEATGQELQRTNAAIDFLIGLEAVDPGAGPARREPDGPPEREQQR